jgi:hypothetical protein
MTTTKVQAYATQTASSALAAFAITRREPGPLDVEIEIPFSVATQLNNDFQH